MIIIILLMLLFSITMTFKKLNYSSTQFMYGIIFSWVLSFIAYILYLSKFNYYFNTINKIFDFSPGTWNYLVLIKFNPNMLIRFLNGGVILFHCFLLCFAVSFTRNLKPGIKTALYTCSCVLFVLQMILYDPYVQILWQSHASYSTVFDAVNLSFKAIKYITILVSFGLLLGYYIYYPKIKFLKNLTLYHILGLIPITALHLLLFTWAPKNLVKPTYMEGYYNYLQPPLGANTFVLSVLPYAVYVALILAFVILYKFNSIEMYSKNWDVRINKSIDTATMGARAFTHATKNHLIAIRSEAEYLSGLHKADEETAYSLNLILKSCESALGSINDAVDKLKHIQLNLQPLSLEVPVRMAMELINRREYSAVIRYTSDPLLSLSYLDPDHMCETLYNILENAAESLSMRDNGLITIETTERNGWGIIRISDNGPGISEEVLDLIFDPFFTTKSSINNWGIGLSYCHKIVTAHDGKIEVESESTKGTTFTIYLPLVK
ncbi:sensor histidine kinase [Paenibacillus silviterrae]|uniref:sensor histidine kinase n=1 Tax=Paenibacillus silviterrae TaxID=3242194 RepID=UPI0025427EF8|nr:HAMP domain-containing sensor histidine kinase [Paenibacillus chinjuensis]